MGLSAMMDLMLKQMHEQAVAALCLHPRVAIDTHDLAKPVCCERAADCNQAFVDGDLSLLERGNGRVRDIVLKALGPSQPPSSAST